MKIPDVPSMLGTVLRRVPRSLCQQLLGHRLELGGIGFVEGKEVGLVIVWEGEDLLHCFGRPAEDDLLRAPGGVTFAGLLKGDWLLPCNAVFVASQFFSESCVAMASYSEVYGSLVSAKSSRCCGGAVCRVERVSIGLSLTVLVVAQKKAADSTYPMGIDRWKPTSWSLSGVAFGTSNATDGISLRRTHTRIYASARSTL